MLHLYLPETENSPAVWQIVKQHSVADAKSHNYR
jgi:hypothetical protein